jgi:hypothetical protein
MFRCLQIFVAVLILLLCGGCAGQKDSVRTITHDKLVRFVERTQGNSFPTQAYYCGSADGHDYFQTKAFVLSGSGVVNYRIKSTECPLTRRFPLAEDESRWLRYYPQHGRFSDEFSWGLPQTTNSFLMSPMSPLWTNTLWKPLP